MIESILTEAANTKFDFREYAQPGDPWAEKFEEWVPYYRLKFAIAKVLQPKTILEIGVRFGYSANAFLCAAPSAKLLGIDLDCDRFGGEVGALDWARRITKDFDARFIIEDTQRLKRLPGGVYDLVHVDGQQDGLGTFHDLRRAVSQARWVLLDGYFWTQMNFLNANDFILKYKDIIHYAAIIPGYAGELLIRVSDEYLKSIGDTPSSGASSSADLREQYRSEYYLHDCGGYQSFRESAGKQVNDPRSVSLLALCSLTGNKDVLDLGCARGEIAYQLALQGSEVTAVDYSTASIEHAKSCFQETPEAVRNRIHFLCADATSLALGKNFDTVIAGDLIEHLSSAELERLFQSVSRHLNSDGVFIVHTFPNLWFYKRHHPRLQRLAERIGAFLPSEPRSRYELLMHINEQSPAGLRRSLSKSFNYVHVWVGNSEAPGQNLLHKCGMAELVSGREIYALASHSPLDLTRAKQLLTQDELPEGVHYKVRVAPREWPETARAGSQFRVRVKLVNGSEHKLSSMPPFPVNLSYHWIDPKEGRPMIFDGVRTPLPGIVAAGDTRTLLVTVQALSIVGRFELQVTLVQEGSTWFDQIAKTSVAHGEILIN